MGEGTKARRHEGTKWAVNAHAGRWCGVRSSPSPHPGLERIGAAIPRLRPELMTAPTSRGELVDGHDLPNPIVPSCLRASVPEAPEGRP